VVVSAYNSFHGRTLATLHATGQPAKHEAFQPMPEGFRHVAFDDLEALEGAIDPSVTAVLLEPVQGEGGVQPATPDYFQGVRRLCDRYGIVFILDDVRAGFRLHLGGSGEYFGVRPDLSCYCKAIANGYALSAAVGRDALRNAAQEVFFTGSYFTSGVPMAAALATLRTLAADDGVGRMDALGTRLCTGLDEAARVHDLRVTTSGPTSCIRIRPMPP